ncbi:hypothetical protein N7486_000454 [Penicillium sp. IBT 16267x]|nr:hypothetical protein N7486_000454 [Penicillium sp. IBT 16267x]
MGLREEFRGVTKGRGEGDQKLSTNGGFWTFPSARPALYEVCILNVPSLTSFQANLPNLRRLFVEARTEVEENEYSRTAFYNLVLFISSVAIFSLAAQRMSGPKTGR